MDESTPAIRAATAAGIDFTVTRHGPVSSLEDAAAARGVAPGDLLNSHEARTTLSSVLAEVERGGEVIIARNNKPIAVTIRRLS